MTSCLSRHIHTHARSHEVRQAIECRQSLGLRLLLLPSSSSSAAGERRSRLLHPSHALSLSLLSSLSLTHAVLLFTCVPHPLSLALTLLLSRRVTSRSGRRRADTAGLACVREKEKLNVDQVSAAAAAGEGSEWREGITGGKEQERVRACVS